MMLNSVRFTPFSTINSKFNKHYEVVEIATKVVFTTKQRMFKEQILLPGNFTQLPVAMDVTFRMSLDTMSRPQ